jgi:hypothetical protein
VMTNNRLIQYFSKDKSVVFVLSNIDNLNGYDICSYDGCR